MSQRGDAIAGFRISGQVQGVGFRWWTRKQALELGLRGSVRNLRDGTVEVLAAGAPESIDMLRARLHEGPPGARVNDVDEIPAAPADVPSDDFHIRH